MNIIYNCPKKESPQQGYGSQRLYRSQRGVTLIEALISMVIFAVGAIGMAAMQLSMLNASGDSQQRTLAIWKAQEFADRIRSNPGLVDAYVANIGSSELDTIGVDSAADIFACGAAPTTKCSDLVGDNADDCTDDDDKVDFDIWEVFCDATTGAAVASADVADGATGLVNLEVVLRQNVAATDGNDDLELYLEWFARESDAVEDITNEDASANTVATDLCGRENVPVDSRLDVYCLRFRP